MEHLPSHDEQLKILSELIKDTQLEVGEEAYLISHPWFVKWKENVGYRCDRIDHYIDPINNSNFLDDNAQMLPTAAENINYDIVTKQVWDKLYDWFGGGPCVKFNVVEDNNRTVVALVNFDINIVYKEQTKPLFISRHWTFQQVLDEGKKLFHIPENEENRLIDYYGERFYAKCKLTEFVSSANILAKQHFLIDYKDASGKWNQKDTKDNYMVSNSTYRYQSTPPQGPGKVGFNNMGNTCFFNSGTQCIIHQMPFIEMFLHTDWKADLNVSNPIGMKGKLATAFGNLVDKVWNNPQSGSIAPSELKHVVGEFAPQFAGWGQQDSHELITFMLDGIHEDLNRRRTKPVVEAVTGNGSDDVETAQKAWANHLARNDSIVVDNFHSLLRSRLICPECHQVTTVFDPYSTLTLPISKPRSTAYTAYFVPFDFKENRQWLTLSLPARADLAETSRIVSRQVGRDLKCIFGYASTHNQAQIYWEVPEQSSMHKFYVFEVPDYEHYYTPYVVKMRMKAHMTQEKTIAGPFLLQFSKPQPTIDEASAIVERQLAAVLDPREAIPDTPRIELLKQKLYFPPPYDPDSDNNCPSSHFTVIQPLDYWKQAIPFRYDMNKLGSTLLTVIAQPDADFQLAVLMRHNDTADEPLQQPKSAMNLDQCFTIFRQEEQLDEQNQWFCPHCRAFVCAHKKMDIWDVPPILVIALKRFTQSENWPTKDNSDVAFPDILDMSPYVIGPQTEKPVYRLTAVSEHMGGMGGGHYTAMALVVPDRGWDGEWYSFNDQSCSRGNVSDAHSSAAYVLFYQRIPESRSSFPPSHTDVD